MTLTVKFLSTNPHTATCPPLEDPANGMISNYSMPPESNNQYPVGAIATFTCSNIAEQFGDETRTCQANHTWTNSSPTCQSKTHCSCIP